MSAHWTITRADTAKTQLADRLAKLCTRRLEEWRKRFARKFPRFHGRIIFGNGTCLVTYAMTRSRLEHDLEGLRSMRGLVAALDDVNQITDGYRLACPEDFWF
jgi:hypothetical protein